jgi:excinuclease UvrABC nuclease subunit
VTHHVYTFWNTATKQPLYVGCTDNLHRRMRQHAGAPWATEATFIAAVSFESPAEAFEAEADRIYKLRPVYNVLHNPRHWPLADLQRPWVTPSATARKRASLAALSAARMKRLGQLADTG